MTLPFTLKTNAEKQIQNLSLKNTVLFGLPKKEHFWFLKKNPPKKCLRVSALFRFKFNRGTNVLLVGIIENALKKLLDVKPSCKLFKP